MIGDAAQTRDRKAVYEQGATWADDVHGSLRASRRVAWVVAAAAVTVAVLEALALAFLAPLKTVVPYTITVDRQSGYVETVRGLEPGGVLTEDAALTQSFLVQYVIARESFDATDLRENYQKVLLWSSGVAESTYQRDMQRSNPSSPLNIYPASAVVAVTVKSVSLLTPTTALVRFDTTRRDAGAATGQEQGWTAVIAFRYTGAPMSNGDRFINPLGFQVTSYRRDADTPAAAVAPPQPPVPTLQPQPAPGRIVP
ncbi:MAG: type IV secretion system protein [Proteobacteria bacterium]|nr:type IV secretion system protein [Pseudomonadota bacterium]